MADNTMGAFNSPVEQLQILNDAIYKIMVGGQSYKIGTRSLTRADLGTLIAERNRLEAQMEGNGTTLLSGAYAVRGYCRFRYRCWRWMNWIPLRFSLKSRVIRLWEALNTTDGTDRKATGFGNIQ